MSSRLERGHLRAALVDVRRSEARVDVYGQETVRTAEIVMTTTAGGVISGILTRIVAEDDGAAASARSGVRNHSNTAARGRGFPL